jgi:hypothetical protein
MPAYKPVLTEGALGDRGWRVFLELARQRGRHPRDQALSLILYALDCALAGKDVELSQERLTALLDEREVAEGVAA